MAEAINKSDCAYRTMEVFVASEAVVNITRPSRVDNPQRSVTVDLTNQVSQLVELECTGPNGIPSPNLVWYIDSPSNTLSNQPGTNCGADMKCTSSLQLRLERNR